MERQTPQNLLLWLVGVGFFMQTLDTTIVNTALPAMAHDLNESPLRLQSVIIAYALTMAITIPASGWLADRFGTRNIFFLAIVLFSAGSLACAMSQTLLQLSLSRILQGVGGAMLLPVGRLAVLRSFPHEKFLKAISLVAIPSLIGPLIGPTVGGWLVEVASWHWIFLINLPIGLVGAILCWKFMPNTTLNQSPPFDSVGFILLAVGMLAVSLGLDGVSSLHFAYSLVFFLLLAGMVSLFLYWLHAVHNPRPLFSPKLFRTRRFAIGLAGNLFARIGAGGMPFLIPLLLQLSMGYSPFQAGLMLLASGSAALLSKPLATSSIGHFGYRRVLVGNTVMLGLVIMCFALVSVSSSLWLHIVLLAVFGAINSVQFTAMNSVTLKDLPTVRASSGNSMLSMIQMLAMSLSVSIAGALLGVFSRWLDTSGDPEAAFQATYVCIGLMTVASAWVFKRLPPDTSGSSGK